MKFIYSSPVHLLFIMQIVRTVLHNILLNHKGCKMCVRTLYSRIFVINYIKVDLMTNDSDPFNRYSWRYNKSLVYKIFIAVTHHFYYLSKLDYI